MPPKPVSTFTPLDPIKESQPTTPQKEPEETGVHDTSFNLGDQGGSPDFVLHPKLTPSNQQNELSPDQLLKGLTLEQVVRTAENNSPDKKERSQNPANLFAAQESLQQLKSPPSKKITPADKSSKTEIEQNFTLPPPVIAKRKRKQEGEERDDHQKSRRLNL